MILSIIIRNDLMFTNEFSDLLVEHMRSVIRQLHLIIVIHAGRYKRTEVETNF